MVLILAPTPAVDGAALKEPAIILAVDSSLAMIITSPNSVSEYGLITKPTPINT